MYVDDTMIDLLGITATSGNTFVSGAVYDALNQLEYVGMTAQRQKSYKEPFMTDEIEEQTRSFAAKIIEFD